MAQTPSRSPLCKLWIDHLQKHVSVTSGHPASWPANIHTMQGHTHVVDSVAYSPDGSHVVSGSWDKTIRIWNATTGQLVAGPFQGHTDVVTSVTYSPDGGYILSASNDKSIKVCRLQHLVSFGDLCVENGWIQSSNGACFGWIAPWNRHAFCLYPHSLVIASDRSYQVDVDASLFGESLISCWN